MSTALTVDNLLVDQIDGHWIVVEVFPWREQLLAEDVGHVQSARIVSLVQLAHFQAREDIEDVIVVETK